MESLGGYTQEELNELWSEANSDSPPEGVTIQVDDSVEQAMTIVSPDGLVEVTRDPGGEWTDIPGSENSNS